ncbi:MAG: DUF2125 domain-containing protein [Pseudomonadota bacterium]
MRKLVGVVVLVAILLSGVWLGWAYALERGFAGWLEARRAEGWVAEATVIDTTGYPTRFSTIVTNLDLADPATGLAWRLPQITFEAAAHKPTDIEAVLPPAFTVASPDERISVRAGNLRASTAVDPGPALRLRRADITLAGIDLRSTAGWDAALADGLLRTERDPDDETTQKIVFSATEVRPAEPLRALLDPAGILPDTMSEMEMRADLGFDRPWDRRAIEERRPQIRAIDLSRLRAIWGDAELEAAGQLTVDAEGVPTGEITVRATNWRDIFAVLQNAGLVPEPFARALESVLESLAGLSGDPDTIDAPLRLSNGFVSFGPIPLGPAPNLRIR